MKGEGSFFNVSAQALAQGQDGSWLFDPLGPLPEGEGIRVGWSIGLRSPHLSTVLVQGGRCSTEPRLWLGVL